jgi:hypothetical protein
MKSRLALIGQVPSDANPEVLSSTAKAIQDELQGQIRHNHLLKKGLVNFNKNHNTTPTLKRSG